MGLDLTGYTNVRVLREVTERELRDGDFVDENWDHILHVHPDWPQRMDGTETDVPINLDGTGAYLFTSDETTYDWQAACGGYSRIREVLCEAVNNVPVQRLWAMDDPSGFYLYELLDFADNEGTIGSAACVKIAQELNDVLDLFPVEPDSGFEKWDFKKIHELAAFYTAVGDKGLVTFH